MSVHFGYTYELLSSLPTSGWQNQGLHLYSVYIFKVLVFTWIYSNTQIYLIILLFLKDTWLRVFVTRGLRVFVTRGSDLNDQEQIQPSVVLKSLLTWVLALSHILVSEDFGRIMQSPSSLFRSPFLPLFTYCLGPMAQPLDKQQAGQSQWSDNPLSRHTAHLSMSK